MSEGTEGGTYTRLTEKQVYVWQAQNVTRQRSRELLLDNDVIFLDQALDRNDVDPTLCYLNAQAPGEETLRAPPRQCLDSGPSVA